MFTGIVSGVGKIVQVSPKLSGVSVLVEPCADRMGFQFSDVLVGDSLCVSGVCLTVVSVANNCFSFDVSLETLSCTCGLDFMNSLVNLEPSLKPSSTIGGHFVFGHVDCVGKIVEWTQIEECWKMVVSAPRSLAQYIAKKGSVAIDGISLTVNSIADSTDDVRFSINLIPYTLSHTIASGFQLSAFVNVEVDMMSRYVSRFAEVFLNRSGNDVV